MLLRFFMVQVLIGLVLVFVNTKAATHDSAIVRNFASAFAILTFLLLFAQLRHVVTRKMGGYNNGWVYQWW